jgi:hypothetical protein
LKINLSCTNNFSAFSQGKVPSNKQIDVALNSFLASKALSSPSGKLSAEGRELVADVRSVIENAKQLILTKNDGNLLQDFIWHTQQLSGGSATLPGAPVDKDTAKKHGNDALEGLRTLGTLVISNGQFRKLLSDSLVLLRSIAGDAASNAAQKIQPSEEQLSQIDAPAADNTWHDVPDLSTGNIKNQIKSNVPIGKKDVIDAKDKALQNQDDPRAAASAAAGHLNNKASDNVDESQKDQVREKRDQAREKRDAYKAKTKDYFSNKVRIQPIINSV